MNCLTECPSCSILQRALQHRGNDLRRHTCSCDTCKQRISIDRYLIGNQNQAEARVEPGKFSLPFSLAESRWTLSQGIRIAQVPTRLTRSRNRRLIEDQLRISAVSSANRKSRIVTSRSNHRNVEDVEELSALSIPRTDRASAGGSRSRGSGRKTRTTGPRCVCVMTMTSAPRGPARWLAALLAHRGLSGAAARRMPRQTAARARAAESLDIPDPVLAGRK